MKISDFKRGWLVGSFPDALLNRKDIEVGVQEYKRGDRTEIHFHKECNEINIVLRGRIEVTTNYYIKQTTQFYTGDIFIIPKNTISNCYFPIDAQILCIKDNSNPKDKYFL